MRGAAGLAHFFAIADLSELNLDRESGPIYPRNRGFHQPKCSFHFFDPTGNSDGFGAALAVKPLCSGAV
jgi:hypothetical protein